MTNVDHAQPQPVSSYITTWFIILALFAVSIGFSQVSSSRPLILIVIFSIAVVQAIMVAAYFMHLKGERPYIHYLLFSMLVAMALLYMGTQADNSHFSGQHWTATDSTRIVKEHEGHPVGQSDEHSHSGEHAAEHAAP
jgi:caa(3)-type oxidase subunit IV